MRPALCTLPLICVLLVQHTARSQSPCNPPAEEDREHTVTYAGWTRPPPGYRMSWSLVDLSTGSQATIYESDRTGNPNIFPTLFMAEDPPRAIRILDVTRQWETTFSYSEAVFDVAGNRPPVEKFSCALKVYRKPVTPTCSIIEDNVDDGTFTTECVTAKVYPQALCQVYVDGSQYPSTIKYSSTIESGDPTDFTNPVYYTTTCKIQYNVPGLTQGLHTVSVRMWPNVTGLTADNGVASNPLNQSLSLPTVSLTQCAEGSNVVDGYLLQGTSTTCTCNLVHQGVPKGTVHWSSSGGGDFTQLRASASLVEIQISAAGTYTCEGRSVLLPPSSGFMKTEKTLQAAYGPINAEFRRDGPTSPIDLCPSAVPTVRVRCVVEKTDVRPSPVYNLSFSTPNAFTIDQMPLSNTTTKYTQVYNLQPVVQGLHTLSCVVRNKFFLGLIINKTLSISVRAPPVASPIIEVTSSRADNLLVEAENITLTCTVNGGTPTMDNVTITCGNLTSHTERGNSAALTIHNISLCYHRAICTCKASHVTQCYHRTATVTLHISPFDANPVHVKDDDDDPPIGAIVGGLLALTVVLVLGAFVAGMYVGAKRRTKRSLPKQGKQESTDPLPQQQQEIGGTRQRNRQQRREKQMQEQQQGQQQEPQQQQQQQDQHNETPKDALSFSRNAYEEINRGSVTSVSYSPIDQSAVKPHMYMPIAFGNGGSGPQKLYANVTDPSEYENDSPRKQHAQPESPDVIKTKATATGPGDTIPSYTNGPCEAMGPDPERLSQSYANIM